MGRALSGLESAMELTDDYAQHPDRSALQAYVQGALPRGYRAELAADFAGGQLKEWHQAEVGLHVKTCPTCWGQVIALRMERKAETTRSAPHQSPRQAWLPRWGLAVALPAALVVGFLLGNGAHLWSLNPEEDIGQMSPTPLSTGGLGEPQGLVELLKSNGVDLTPFDLKAHFTAYRVGPQDTLQSIAAAQWGDATRWIVIYLFNYQALQHLSAPAQEALAQPLTLQLPLLLP